MSKAVVPLPVLAVEDPVTRLHRPNAFGVNQGGVVYTYQQIVAQNNASSANPIVPQTITFVAPPPSPDIIVDRRVYLSITWKISPSGTYTSLAPFRAGYDAPRAFPNMQALNSVSVVVNNNTITQQMDPIIALMNYNMDRHLQNYDYSCAPSMLDQYPDYYLAASSNLPRNPLATHGNNVFQEPRGGFAVQYDNVDIAPPADGSFGPTQSAGNNPSATFTSIEPLFLTPFEQYGESPGFFGVQTLNVNLQFQNNGLSRIWSHAVGPLGQGGAPWSKTIPPLVQLLDAKLLFRYITPSPIKVMPSVMEYPYSALNIYLTRTSGAAAPYAQPANGVSPLTSNSIQFNTIPDQIFIYLMRQVSDRDHTTSDTFGVISNININFMNQTGLLNSATQWDLYNMSRKNGYIGSFEEWGCTQAPTGYNPATASPTPPIGASTCTGFSLGSTDIIGNYRGSVLCIRPGLDLGLEPSIAPSMNGLYNFQIQSLTWWNPCQGYTQASQTSDTSVASPSSTNYMLYVVTVTSGIVTVKDNGTVTQTGLLTRADVLRAQAAPAMASNEAQKLVGGEFFSNIKSLLGRRGAGAGTMYGGSADASSPAASVSASMSLDSYGHGHSGGCIDPMSSGIPMEVDQYQRERAAPAPQAEPWASGVGSGGQMQGQGHSSAPSHGQKRKQHDDYDDYDPRERYMPQRRLTSDSGSGWSPSRDYVDPYDTKRGDTPGRDDFIDEDRYRREAPCRDQRSPSERYDSAMPDMPTERVSRRKDSDYPSEEPRRGAVFRS